MKVSKDPYHLQRFVVAQGEVYETVISELRNGHKRSHWMWFVFPQLDGLGFSSTAKFYAIQSLEEAKAYLQHNVLGQNLLECVHTVLAAEGRSVHDIFGTPDDLKLKSCMTLFEFVDGPESVFGKVLDKFYAGERDDKTLQLLQEVKE